MNPNIATVQVFLNNNISDPVAKKLRDRAKKYLGIDTGNIKTGKLYLIDYPMQPEELTLFASAGLSDCILHNFLINAPIPVEGFGSCVIVAKQPGVTDDEGKSAQNTLADIFNINYDLSRQHIFTQDIYLIEAYLPDHQLRLVAESFMGNKQIHKFIFSFAGTQPELYLPTVVISSDTTVSVIDLNISDEQLMKLNEDRHLALTLEEMLAIKNYYNSTAVQEYRASHNLPLQPTDCELEIFAQTWSEHCKHKEFNAVIEFTNKETGTKEIINSLFKTYIRAATEQVAEYLTMKGDNWLVKVFTDNAGAVKINDDSLFVWKVETHNSPSAIDPYGGAITGILGNNRDPLGTGIGGAHLLFNTNVLCFGRPDYSKELLPGQLHPLRLFEGVVKGIEDGGNKSGIPTINGSIVFDNRYSGKPLVYCGTGGILPAFYGHRHSEEKRIDAGDLIFSVGGRVGKDGIHGATFSSRNLDESSPQSAVQIGSPITQKLVSDFMQVAAREGLIKCSTDCGAGGLSSAIGELAQLSGGADVALENVKLKYSGLKPWEIFLSESQERMILVVKPEDRERFNVLARHFDIEVSELGKFTDDGYLRVTSGNEFVAALNLDFLHNGVPVKYMQAEWEAPGSLAFSYEAKRNYTEDVLKLLASYNICSREPVIRKYDHEVKGKSIVKPLMGIHGDAPQDAAVMRFTFDGYEGVAVSNGLMPKYADANPYASAQGAFDEAVRSIIAVGGLLPEDDDAQGNFWSVNDNFCVPDSLYDPAVNPDGKRKLGRLVLMCKALYDMSVKFHIPMTSGKDSMKNDFKSGETKISVPPTVLFSVAAKLTDVRKSITSEFKLPGSLIYQVGKTYSELGCSEYAVLTGKSGGVVPIVRPDDALAVYKKIMLAGKNQLLLSAHDISDGGMITAAIECCFGTQCGMELSLDAYNGLKTEDILFSESHSRFVVSVAEHNKEIFEELFGEDCLLIGRVTDENVITVMINGTEIVSGRTEEFLTSFKNGLRMN